MIPPRILQQGGFLSEQEVLLVRRPLYGLRESPALWAQYRTEVLKTLHLDHDGGTIRLQQLRTDSELWLVLMSKEGAHTLEGIIVTYVDDLLYLCCVELMKKIHGWVKGKWPCADLELAIQPGGIRYLGMELVQYEDGTFSLGQEGYVENLTKAHGLDQDASAGLPCPKEWVKDTDYLVEEENYTIDELRRGQIIVFVACLPYPTRHPLHHQLHVDHGGEIPLLGVQDGLESSGLFECNLVLEVEDRWENSKPRRSSATRCPKPRRSSATRCPKPRRSSTTRCPKPRRSTATRSKQQQQSKHARVT